MLTAQHALDIIVYSITDHVLAKNELLKKGAGVIYYSQTISSKNMPGLSHFMILRYLLSSLFSQPVFPTQAEYFLPALGEPPVKRERTTHNANPKMGKA